MAVAVYNAAEALLRERNNGRPLGLADEGGFGPALGSNRAALDVVVAAIERAGYKPGEDMRPGPRYRGDALLRGGHVSLPRRGSTHDRA